MGSTTSYVPRASPNCAYIYIYIYLFIVSGFVNTIIMSQLTYRWSLNFDMATVCSKGAILCNPNRLYALDYFLFLSWAHSLFYRGFLSSSWAFKLTSPQLHSLSYCCVHVLHLCPRLLIQPPLGHAINLVNHSSLVKRHATVHEGLQGLPMVHIIRHSLWLRVLLSRLAALYLRAMYLHLKWSRISREIKFLLSPTMGLNLV